MNLDILKRIGVVKLILLLHFTFAPKCLATVGGLTARNPTIARGQCTLIFLINVLALFNILGGKFFEIILQQMKISLQNSLIIHP